MRLVTAAASKVSLCLIFFHINYPQANQFYDASDDWNKKQAVIESISHVYHNLPNPTLNFSETKFKSLYIPSEWFIAEKKLLKVDLHDKRESLTSVIGVGGAFARSNNSTFVAYGGWSSQCLKCGAAFVLRYEGVKLCPSQDRVGAAREQELDHVQFVRRGGIVQCNVQWRVAPRGSVVDPCSGI